MKEVTRGDEYRQGEETSQVPFRPNPLPAKSLAPHLATLPVPSVTGLAPTRCSTMPTLSPLVLIASRPHRLTATVSGSLPASR